jgi:putative hydrolase of the HAD superfamily
MVKAIIFDLDNTLTDFVKMKENSIEAAIDAMIDAGLTMRRSEIRKKIFDIYEREGIEHQRVFNYFLQQELGQIDDKKLAAAIVAYRRARDSALVLYPHVHMTLVELVKRGIKLAVVTDAASLQAWLRLCYLQLQHVFDHVVTYEDTGEYKPSPAPFLRALSLLGVSAEEALMVGDWPERDMVGASKLGMKTVFARYGDTFGTVQSGADYEVTDVIQLIDIIDKINEKASKS